MSSKRIGGGINATCRLVAEIKQSETAHEEKFYHSAHIDIFLQGEEGTKTIESFDLRAGQEEPVLAEMSTQITTDLHHVLQYCEIDQQSVHKFLLSAVSAARDLLRTLPGDALENQPSTVIRKIIS